MSFKNVNKQLTCQLNTGHVPLIKDSRSHRLNMTFVSFSLEGQLLDIGTVNGAMFQMCNGSFQEFDAAFNFGTRYYKKCQIPPHILFKHPPTPIFYDLYIPYKSETSNVRSSNKLFAVPMMILNKDQNKVWLQFVYII